MPLQWPLRLGSLLMPACLAASALAESVGQLVLTLGVVMGVSIGLVFMPAISVRVSGRERVGGCGGGARMEGAVHHERAVRVCE